MSAQMIPGIIASKAHYPCSLWIDKCDFRKIFWIISSSKFHNSFTPRDIYLWHSYEVHKENVSQTLVFLSDNSDLLPEFWIQFRESLPILNSLTKNESPFDFNGILLGWGKVFACCWKKNGSWNEAGAKRQAIFLRQHLNP